MAYGFHIERKNHILFIGKPPDELRIIRYVFDGWTNEDQKKKFFGSVMFLWEEACAGRIMPMLRGSNLFFILSTANELDDEGTPKGSILKIEFEDSWGSIEKIEKFFNDSGIAIYRAEPFEKPVKTIWQIIGEKFKKKKS